jgi:acyl-CoA synthetase (AMP-forming)/AMP-acid ligase II
MLGALVLGAQVWMVNPDDPPARLRRQLDARHPDLCLGEMDGAGFPTASATGSEITPVPVGPATPALLFNTSGSTGVPKAVVQSHAAIIANARSFTEHHRLQPGRRVLGFLPIHHVNAVHSNLMSTLYSGAECVLLRPDSLIRLHRYIESTRPYLLSLVPSAAEALLVAWRKPTVPDSLSHVLSAAAPLSARTAGTFQAKFGRRIIQGYGLSETMNFSTTVPVDLDNETYARVTTNAERPSIGRPIPGVDVQVLDAAGDAVGEEGIGELCIRGPHLMSEYDADEPATRAAFRDGWFLTGDLGYCHTEPGVGPMFYITGRSKNIAKVRGEQIALEEIENALVALPGIADAGCVALPDPWDGERIVAGIVAQPGAPGTDEVRRRLAARLPSAGIPRQFVVLPRVPRTATGKVLRAELAEAVRAADR